nr:hypothetical protein Iba_chr07fCG4310 [Ipomoea batatas]
MSGRGDGRPLGLGINLLGEVKGLQNFKLSVYEGKPKFIPFNDELMDTADVEEDLLYMLLGTTHAGQGICLC